MGARRLSRAVIVGVVTVGATVGLLGLPAAADTSDVTVTGALDLYSFDNDHLFDVEVGTTLECDDPSGTFSMSGGSSSGAWSLSFTRDEILGYLGVPWLGAPLRWRVEGDFSGSYTTTGLTGSGSLTLSIRPTTEGGSCTYLETGVTCTLSATDVLLYSGSHTVSPAPTIDLGDTGGLLAANEIAGDFGYELAASGNCGSLFELDDGYVDAELDWTAV